MLIVVNRANCNIGITSGKDTNNNLMALYKNAFYWFIGLLLILIVGFWESYFSKLPNTGHVTHHAHGIVMLAWVLLLISQSWLIRNRRNANHRTLGKISFVLAPAIVMTAVLVNFYFLANAEDPVAPLTQRIYWFGYFSAALFAVMYGLAIRNRRQVNLHARYMVATALVFLVPGLLRAISNYLAPLGIWTPDFFQTTWIPFFIGVWLLFADWRNQRDIRPYATFCSLWVANFALWLLLPTWGWWATFSAWSATAFSL